MKKHNCKKDRSAEIALIVFQLWSLYFVAAARLASWMWVYYGYGQWNGCEAPPVRSPLFQFLSDSSIWWGGRLGPFWCLLCTILALIFAVRLLLHLARRIRLSSVPFSICMLVLSAINAIGYGWISIRIIMSI